MGESQIDAAAAGIGVQSSESLGQQARELIADRKFDLVMPDELYEAIRRNPELFAHYLPLISGKNDKGVQVFGDHVVGLIDKRPEIAEQLMRVFDEVPELIPLYARFSVDVHSDDGRAADVPVVGTRLSASTNPETILAHIQKVKRYNAELAEKLRIQLAANHLPYTDEVVASELFGGVGTVSLLRIGQPDHKLRGLDSIQVRVKPTDWKQGDFPAYELRLRDEGLVDSTYAFNDYGNLGYRLRGTPFDEQAVLSALCEEQFGSRELNDRLDDIPSLQKYIEDNLR